MVHRLPFAFFSFFLLGFLGLLRFAFCVSCFNSVPIYWPKQLDFTSMADIFSDTKQGVYLYRFTSQYGTELTSFLVTHHRMTSAALLPDPWLEPKTQNRPGPCIRWLWAWTSWFWLFALIFDQKLKFPKGPILLSFSRRFQFWTPFLHLKLWNWSIGIFFIVVSSKAFFKWSSHAYLTSNLQASAISLREGVRDIY